MIQPDVRHRGLLTDDEEGRHVITIGIDPHKSSLTAVALDQTGGLVATLRLDVTSTTVKGLLAWARHWEQRRWAVERAAGLGRGVT